MPIGQGVLLHIFIWQILLPLKTCTAVVHNLVITNVIVWNATEATVLTKLLVMQMYLTTIKIVAT